MKNKDVISSTKKLNQFSTLLVVIFMALAFSSCASGKKSAAAGTGTPSPSLLSAAPVQKTDQTSEETPFVVVEEMPVFPGGDEALLKYIAVNTKYPENAKKNKIQGKVILRFCVTEKGGVNKISVLQGVDPELDAEAIRVAGTLPAFTPGKQGGRDVPVWYMIPITFALN